MTVPTHSNMLLQPQRIIIKALTYPDFYLPDPLNPRMSQVMCATSNKKTPDGNLVAILEMDNFSWHHSTRTDAVDRANCKMYVTTIRGCTAAP